jgi:hypothetical protein
MDGDSGEEYISPSGIICKSILFIKCMYNTHFIYKHKKQYFILCNYVSKGVHV